MDLSKVAEAVLDLIRGWAKKTGVVEENRLIRCHDGPFAVTERVLFSTTAMEGAESLEPAAPFGPGGISCLPFERTRACLFKDGLLRVSMSNCF